MTVNTLAARLEVAPATVSLRVGELSRQGILRRDADESDRRRTIVSISEAHRPAIDGRPARGAQAWRRAPEPLSPEQRRMFVDTLEAYEEGLE